MSGHLLGSIFLFGAAAIWAGESRICWQRGDRSTAELNFIIAALSLVLALVTLP